MHKQTDKQTDRHYENNGHLAVNQLYVRLHYVSKYDADRLMGVQCVRFSLKWSSCGAVPVTTLQKNLTENSISPSTTTCPAKRCEMNVGLCALATNKGANAATAAMENKIRHHSHKTLISYARKRCLCGSKYHQIVWSLGLRSGPRWGGL